MEKFNVATQLDRRGMLRLVTGAAAAAVLAACGGETTATNTPPAAATKAGGSTPVAGGTGGQTPGAIGTLAGGTGGQTPAPAVATTATTAGTSAATPAAGGSAAAATVTKPASTTAATAGATTAPAATTGMAAAPAATAGATTAAGMNAPLLPLPMFTADANAKGNVKYWQTSFDDPSVPSRFYHDQWMDSLKTTLPNVKVTEEQYQYNDLLDKLRIASRANQGPDTVVLPILQGPEFIYQNALQEINLADFGYTADKFWPGALKSVTRDGKLYGIPTNNETMAIMYNMEMFQKAGLDPTKGPDTWEDVKNYSKQIKDKLGKSGFGLVAKLNAGNTPFRYMPLCWSYGGAALDETADNPTYQKSGFDSDGNIAALQWIYDVFVRDQSAPSSSINNTNIEVTNLFQSEEVAMLIGLPGSFTTVRNAAPIIAPKINFSLMPKGPVRRAVVFGGSNMLIFKSAKDLDAAKAVVKNATSPPWSLRLHYEGSNPGNRDGFNLPEEKIREMQTKFLDVSISMLQYGISFPTIPEAADIMNLEVPQMMQDVMTKAKTPEQSAKDTAKKVNDRIAKRK